MAFKLYSTDDGHVPAWEYAPWYGNPPRIGTAIKSINGKYYSTEEPTHILMHEDDKELEGRFLPAVKIAEDQVWESRLYKYAPSAVVGMRVDIASGNRVDATKSNKGNFLITYLEGTYKGSVVRGRFVPEKTTEAT